MTYWLLGYWVRREACRLAAASIREHSDVEGGRPVLLWSHAVFFEMYLLNGAEGTRGDFGPKDPEQLKVVKPSTEAGQK